MLSKSTLRDVFRVDVGIYVGGAIMLIVFALLKKLDMSVVLGALLGCTFSCLSFLVLAFSLENSVGSGANTARARMGLSYTVRLIAAGCMIYWAIKAPYFNHWAAIIPLFFQRAVITILSFTDNNKGGKQREC